MKQTDRNQADQVPEQKIEIGMGQGVVTRSTQIISSMGLTSCVVVALYDRKRKIGGLAHIMLPDSSDMNGVVRKSGSWNAIAAEYEGKEKKVERSRPTKVKDCRCSDTAARVADYRCADTAIAALLQGLRENGSMRLDIVAKLAGGARMFNSCEEDVPGIGEQNIASTRMILLREEIPVMGSDLGGRHGRSVEFHLDSGRMIVRAIGREDKEI